MKKALAWLLVIVMTASLAVGGTLAYLTDTDEDVNVMTVGKVKIDQLEYERVDVESENDDATVQEFHDNKPLYPAVTEEGFDYVPGDTYVDWEQIGKDGYTSEIWNPDSINNEVDKMVFVKNKGDFDAYVRTVFGFEANGFTEEQFKELFHLNINEEDYIWEWNGIQTIDGTNYFIVTATYKDVLAPGAITPISLSQIALDSKATNEDVAGFGDTYQILVQSQAVQADGFIDAPTALNEAFGTIPTEEGEYPFEDDNPTKGIDMKTALHYANGDPAGTKITGTTTKVVFGLIEDYADIANANKGVLVDAGQDVPVNAYYVGDEVYLLASDTIYAPADSNALFDGMAKVAVIDASNLDVSRVENMQAMFRGCKALTSIDMTGWDTSKVTTMKTMFYNCSKITELTGLGELDVSAVTDMYGMFSGCSKLVEVDGSGWDTSNVTTMMGMFNSCPVLETVHCADWDTGNVTSFSAMFQNAKKVKNIDVSNWDTSSCVDMSGMFKNCVSIVNLDVSGWKVDKVQKFNSWFSSGSQNKGDMAIQALDVSNWNPVSAVHMNHMFYGCGQLTELDFSNWNTPALYTTSHMFADCYKLEVMHIKGWTTSDAWYTMDAMFNDCAAVKFMDVSTWTTSGVVEFGQIFESCWSLKEIKGLENWDTSNGKTFDETFKNCGSLMELNLSSFDTRNVCSGYKSLVGDVSKGFNTTFQNVTNLAKLTLGENFVFTGNGTVTAPATLPEADAVEGQTTIWYNEENDTYYTASEIPDQTAATYVAVVKP